jgi:transposase
LRQTSDGQADRLDPPGRALPAPKGSPRTLWLRRHDILAFFDHHASNGPTEAINGRLEAPRRNALGFRNLTHYRWRSLLHSGALHSLVNAL